MILERKAILALLAGALVALAAGCATQPPYTYADQANRNPYMAQIDEKMANEIRQRLRADNGIQSRDIQVNAARGVVRLDGTVRSDGERRRAIDIARGVDGVIGVEDNLRTSG